jgi:hypothetical protein
MFSFGSAAKCWSSSSACLDRYAGYFRENGAIQCCDTGPSVDDFHVCEIASMSAVSGTMTFLALGFLLRLLSNYLREGILLYSSVNAVVWTVVAGLVFIPMYRYFGFSKASIIGSIIYTITFLAVYLYVAVPLRLTLKIYGFYLFLDGHVTWFGFFNYFAIALLDCVFSIVGLFVCFRNSSPND